MYLLKEDRTFKTKIKFVLFCITTLKLLIVSLKKIYTRKNLDRIELVFIFDLIQQKKNYGAIF